MSNHTTETTQEKIEYGIEFNLEGQADYLYIWAFSESFRNVLLSHIRSAMEHPSVHPILQIADYHIPTNKIIWWLPIHRKTGELIRNAGGIYD